MGAWPEAEVWVNRATGANPSQGVSMGVRLLWVGVGKEVARELPPGPQVPCAHSPGSPGQGLLGRPGFASSALSSLFFVVRKGQKTSPPGWPWETREALCHTAP